MKHTLCVLVFLFATTYVAADQTEHVDIKAQPKISLVFDYDLSSRYVSYSNMDYTSIEKKSYDICSQYLNLNVIGKFEDRIEMSAKLASYGLSGRYDKVFDMPYKSRDFAFFLETAFLTFKSEKDFFIPYKFFAGKQEFSYGDGFIVDGNNNGLLGARGKIDLLQVLTLDMFAAKVENATFGLYGVNINFNSFIELGIYQERNDSGFMYKKGLLPPEKDKNRENITHDNKTFYDLRITGGNQTYEYVIEAAQQKGDLVKEEDIEAAQQKGDLVKEEDNVVKYDNYALSLSGLWKGEFLNKNSSAKILFSYAGAKRENSFSPTFSKRYNGLQRIGYGTLFAANNTDSFVVIPNGYYGINTLGALFDVFPFQFLKTGMSIFMYSASDAPADSGSAGFASIYGAKADLGKELDFFVKYQYKNYFDIILNFAVYMPPNNAGKVFLNTDSAYLFQVGVSSKF